MIDQAKTDVFSMWDLFQGKPVVSNLYSKALKLSKDREISATTASLDQLKSYYSECSNIATQDFVNILYNSNFSFRETLDQILPDGTKKPTSLEINKSYAKFFTCKNTISTNDAVTSLNNEINEAYYTVYSNTYSLGALNEDNFWSDFFWNGTLDDSSFDLLYDINQIWKLMFDDFKDSPEVLFYRLPAAQNASTQGGWDLSSLTDQSSYQLWGGGGSFPGTTWWPTWTNPSPPTSWWWVPTPPINPIITPIVQSQTTIPKNQTLSVAEDTEVQNFIEHTNSTATPTTPAGSALVFWNECLSNDTGTAAVYEEPQPVLEDPVTYISGIINFISWASLNDVVDAHLLDVFHKHNPVPTWGNTSGTGVADAIANSYAEQALGGDAAPGTCEYSCNGLPLDEQTKCELKCAGSCIDKCKWLWVQEKALCISDCTCFLIAWPEGEGWQKVEDMFRIKFCKVPVEKKTVKPWKKVFSIQAIFQEISDVLEWLKDSGQMVKFAKTKEYLDGNVKIKFADNFAFKLQVGFKPVFEQKATTTDIQEQTQANEDLSLAVLDMNASAPEADDYDKYVIVSDIIRNKANVQPATSLAEVQANIDEFTKAAEEAKKAKLSGDAISTILASHTQWLDVLVVKNMITFLQDNQWFRQNLSDALLDMNKMALDLKYKIENSK